MAARGDNLPLDSDPQRPSPGGPLTIDDLGWTPQQALEIRARLSSFAEDWDDPGMDVYNQS